MVTELLVDNQIDDGRKLVAELVRGGSDVEVAFWVKPIDAELPSLYIASPLAAPDRLGEAYRRIHECLVRLQNPWVRLSEIKLVEASNPIAREAIALRDRRSGKLDVRIHDRALDGLVVDEGYIYARTAASMTRGEVLQTITLWADDAQALQPRTIVLRDGSHFSAKLVGILFGRPGDIRITFDDVAVAARREVNIDDVANVL